MQAQTQRTHTSPYLVRETNVMCLELPQEDLSPLRAEEVDGVIGVRVITVLSNVPANEVEAGSPTVPVDGVGAGHPE